MSTNQSPTESPMRKTQDEKAQTEVFQAKVTTLNIPGESSQARNPSESLQAKAPKRNVPIKSCQRKNR